MLSTLSDIKKQDLHAQLLPEGQLHAALSMMSFKLSSRASSYHQVLCATAYTWQSEADTCLMQVNTCEGQFKHYMKCQECTLAMLELT